MRPASVEGRRIAALVVAVALAVLAFVFRFNTLGGALGGFDNDHFIYLVRTDALLAGWQPLRDFVDAELRGAWPALSYAVPAWAQQLGGANLRSEAYLTVGLLAVGHAVVFWLALGLSQRWWVAIAAALVAVATVPKLYNYPKVLALACGAWALRAVVADPTPMRLTVAALITAAAVLFRHDLGVYVAAALVAALLIREGARWRTSLRLVVLYGAIVLLLLLPSIVWVQVYEGWPQYLRDAAESVAFEQARTNLELPPFDAAMPLARENMELVGFYAFWAIPLVALVVLAGAAKSGRASREALAVGVGLVVMAALGNRSFLRANLAERFGDVAPAVVLVAAWVAGVAPAFRSRAARAVVVAVTGVALLTALGSAWIYSDIRRELATSGLTETPRDAARRFARLHAELGSVPPLAWTDEHAHGTLLAARYVAECTRPDDRLLTLGPLHEVPVYARRRFAAGQAMFKLTLYTSAAFQQRAIARLREQSVPIVIADTDEFGEFEALYPMVAAYLRQHYRDAGVIQIDGDPRVRVLVATARTPARPHPQLGLPCFV